MIDNVALTKALIPIISPIIDYDASGFLTIRARQDRDRPDNVATVWPRLLYQVGNADKGDMHPINGRSYQSTWITEIDIQLYGDKAGARLNHLRSSINFQTVIDALALAGLGYMRHSQPIDRSIVLDTGYEERSFMTLTFSVRDGDLSHDVGVDAPLTGDLGSPVMNPDEVPIAQTSIESCLLEGAEGRIAYTETITVGAVLQEPRPISEIFRFTAGDEDLIHFGTGSGVARLDSEINNYSLSALDTASEPQYDSINNKIIFDGVDDRFNTLTVSVRSFIVKCGPSNGHIGHIFDCRDAVSGTARAYWNSTTMFPVGCTVEDHLGNTGLGANSGLYYFELAVDHPTVNVFTRYGSTTFGFKGDAYAFTGYNAPLTEEEVEIEFRRFIV